MYGEQNIKDGGHIPEVEVEKRYILASRQDRNGIPTAAPRFSGSSNTMDYMCILYNIQQRLIYHFPGGKPRYVFSTWKNIEAAAIPNYHHLHGYSV